jgi:hypothetical protein
MSRIAYLDATIDSDRKDAAQMGKSIEGYQLQDDGHCSDDIVVIPEAVAAVSNYSHFKGEDICGVSCSILWKSCHASRLPKLRPTL